MSPLLFLLIFTIGLCKPYHCPNETPGRWLEEAEQLHLHGNEHVLVWLVDPSQNAHMMAADCISGLGELHAREGSPDITCHSHQVKVDHLPPKDTDAQSEEYTNGTIQCQIQQAKLHKPTATCVVRSGDGRSGRSASSRDDTENACVAPQNPYGSFSKAAKKKVAMVTTNLLQSEYEAVGGEHDGIIPNASPQQESDHEFGIDASSMKEHSLEEMLESENKKFLLTELKEYITFQRYEHERYQVYIALIMAFIIPILLYKTNFKQTSRCQLKDDIKCSDQFKGGKAESYERTPAIRRHHEFYDVEISSRIYISEDACEQKLGAPPNSPFSSGSSNERLAHIQYAGRREESSAPSRAAISLETSRILASDSPGRISDISGDPPGQMCTYIPPGDTRYESYRVSTFENFPNSSGIDGRRFSKAGFYYTGYFDRVKCFACGRTVEGWQAGDNPGDKKWHKPTCPLVSGVPSTNIPISEMNNRLQSSSMMTQSQSGQDEILQQRDPITGEVTRTIRYPADLPDRVRRAGGIFQIGPGNQVTIQSGPGLQSASTAVGNESAPRRWRMANVVSADHRRFLSNLYLNRELDRLTSFARWPVSRPNVSPAALAKSGFFYLGDMDRTQCFSCGGVLRNWTYEDDAQEEHRTHFHQCHFVRGIDNRNVSVAEEEESPQERETLYPCLYAASPHMRAEASRLSTFDHGWRHGSIAASAAEIAAAGFFYLGERDRVKCWYCNGGLQNWEYDDEPWTEHAKWFPNCQFMLRNKGQRFVHHHLAMNPHLARPIIARQEGSTNDLEANVAEVGDIPPGPRVRQPSPPPVIIDPQAELRRKKENIDNTMKNSDIVKNVLIMGFSPNLVRQLLEERMEAGNVENPNDVFNSTSALLDAVLAKEAQLQEENMEVEDEETNTVFSSVSSAYSTNLSMLSGNSSIGPSPGSGKYNVSYEEGVAVGGPIIGAKASDPRYAESMNAQKSEIQDKNQPLREKLRKIEEERMCKVCLDRNADIVFIPCGHLCCCMTCAQSLRNCPVCRMKIEKAIKTYLT